MAGITMKRPSIIQAVQVLRCHQYTKHTLCNSKENKNRSASFPSSLANVSTSMSRSPVNFFPCNTESETTPGHAAHFVNFHLPRKSRLTLHNHIILWIAVLALKYSYFLRFIPSVNSSACPIIIFRFHTLSSLSLSYTFMHFPMNRYAYPLYQPYELT